MERSVGSRRRTCSEWIGADPIANNRPAVLKASSINDFLADSSQTTNVEAFRRLFCAYIPLVKSFMMRQGADANTAEELAQETLLTVWRKARFYSSDKGSPKAWIFTIARNLRIDRLRKEVSWVALPDGYEQQASVDATPDEAFSSEQRRVRVQRALAVLPPDQHEVVKLSFVEGLSHTDIAQRLGLPLGTVKSRLRLSYVKVRDLVEDLR